MKEFDPYSQGNKLFLVKPPEFLVNIMAEIEKKGPPIDDFNKRALEKYMEAVQDPNTIVIEK